MDEEDKLTSGEVIPPASPGTNAVLVTDQAADHHNDVIKKPEIISQDILPVAPPPRPPRRDKNYIGMITLAMKYVYKTGKLQVEIRQCYDVVPSRKDLLTVDPYVKIYLLPDKSKAGKRKSQILRGTFNPEFNKKLEYEISKDALENRSLYVSLWHNIVFGKNVFLGEAYIPLNLNDMKAKPYQLRRKPRSPLDDESESDDEETDECETLSQGSRTTVKRNSLRSVKSDRSDVMSVFSVKSAASSRSADGIRKPPKVMSLVMYCGDVLVSIKFVPENDVLVIWDKDLESKGEIHVHIKKGLNLTGFGSSGETNAFCKFTVVQNGRVLQKFKTAVIPGTSHPEWNAQRRFENIGVDDLRDTSLVFTVMSKMGLSTKLVGQATITISSEKCDWSRPRCLTDNVIFLEELIHQANSWVEFVVPLRGDVT